MSLKLIDVCKDYRLHRGKRRVLSDINFEILRGERVGFLGRNGAGKSTLVRLIGGSELPTSGRIERDMAVSWPIAFSGGFQGSLTGFDNLRFICRVYNADYEAVKPFVEEFTGLGRYLREPVNTYSSGMGAKLAFAISMAVEFDCFLVDEVLVVGDEKFQERCRYELFEKRTDRAMIMVSHDPGLIREYCSKAGVLDGGHLTMFDSVDDAYSFFRR
ncbi:ABC transporter ATP-binding protein [Frateuria aurantia]